MKPGDGAMSRSSKRVRPGCPVAEWPRRSGLALVGCNRSSTKRGRPNTTEKCGEAPKPRASRGIAPFLFRPRPARAVARY